MLFIAAIVAAGLRCWWLSVTKSEVALPQTTLTQPSSPPENPLDEVAPVLAHPLDEVLEETTPEPDEQAPFKVAVDSPVVEQKTWMCKVSGVICER